MRLHHRMYVKGQPLHLLLDQPGEAGRLRLPSASDDALWQLVKDGRTMGTVASQLGARLTWVFSADLVAKHCLFGALSITALRTYERVGALRLDVHSGGEQQTSERGRAGGLGERRARLPGRAAGWQLRV